MKHSKLSRLENKYYYNVSRFFWHIIIALSLLAIAGGVITYLWSLVPPSKSKVVKAPAPQKQAYPVLKKVALQEILDKLPKQKKNKPAPPKPKPEETQTQEDTGLFEEEQVVTQIDSAALKHFNTAIGNTKSLIPEDEYQIFWNNKYDYYFSSERDRKMYRKSHNPALRKKNLISPGFKQRFITYTDSQNLKDYNQKADLLETYNHILAKIAKKNRKRFMQQIAMQLPVRNLGTHEIQSRLTAIGDVMDKIDADNQLKVYKKLWWFIKSNPNDGIPMINFLASNLEQIPQISRITFIDYLLREYNRHYNNRLSELKEAILSFMPLVKQINPDQMSPALKIYFDLYRKNNYERAKQVRQIDDTYNQELAKIEKDYKQALQRANLDYHLKRQKKDSLRLWSYKGVGLGFAGILLFSLIVLILSMIRNINRLTEAMYENNQMIEKHIKKSDKIK